MRLHHLAVLAIILCSSHAARAQTAGAQAEVLFKQGIALMDQGKYAEACAAFDASDKLDPTTSTTLNRADCREKNGQIATAWGLFLEAERQARAAMDVATQQLHLVAIDHAARLEPRLSRLTVTVAPENRIEGLQLLRGSEPIDPGAWNHALPVDGGTYTITARAPGHDQWLTTVEVGAESDTKEVVVPALVKSPEPPKPPKRASPALHYLPYVFGGAAVVFLGTSLAFELSARSTYDDAKREVDDDKQHDLWQSANTKRYIDDVFLVAGLGCAGVAVWRYLHDRRESATQTTVTPVAGKDSAGVQVFGRF